MKLNFELLRRRWHSPVMLAAGYLPLPLMLCARKTPELPWNGLPVAAVYILAAWLCTIVPGKRRLLVGLPCAALIALTAIFCLPWRTAWILLIIPPVYIALLLGGLAGGGTEAAVVYPCVATLLHAAAQILQLTDVQAGTVMAQPVIAALRASFLVFGGLALYSMNRTSLHEAAAKGSPAPLTVRRRNLLLTVGLGLATMFIACLPAVLRFFGRIVDGFVMLLIALWRMLLALVRDEPVNDGGSLGSMPEGMGAAAQETSLIWKILEVIFIAIAAAAAAVLAVIILRKIWRKLRALLAELVRRMQIFAHAASEDYHDEISDTREGGVRTSLLKRFARKRDPLKGIDETKLPPRERVRFYYLRAMLRRKEWEAGQTARENLADAAATYEKARYSDHAVTEAEAAEFGRKLSGR